MRPRRSRPSTLCSVRGSSFSALPLRLARPASTFGAPDASTAKTHFRTPLFGTGTQERPDLKPWQPPAPPPPPPATLRKPGDAAPNPFGKRLPTARRTRFPPQTPRHRDRAPQLPPPHTAARPHPPIQKNRLDAHRGRRPYIRGQVPRIRPAEAHAVRGRAAPDAAVDGGVRGARAAVPEAVDGELGARGLGAHRAGRCVVRSNGKKRAGPLARPRPALPRRSLSGLVSRRCRLPPIPAGTRLHASVRGWTDVVPDRKSVV